MDILIAEDNHAVRKLLRDQLEAQGYSIVEAADGVEALAALESQPVNAIVSDILMPRMDGYRLCHEVRKSEKWRHLPFIFYTAIYTSEGDEKLARDAGGDLLLHKPASGEKMAQALRAVFEGRGPCQEDPRRTIEQRKLSREFSNSLVAKLEQKNAELTQARETLRARETKMHFQATALETVANAVIITNRHGKILWVNPAFTALTGYTAMEAMGNAPRLLKSGRHDAAFYETFWKTILAGKTWRGEFINRRKDGTLFYGEQTVTPVCDNDGKVTHFVGIMHDVTERKGAEKSLQLFRALIDHSSDAIEVLDPQTGRFLDVNHKGCAELGYSHEEFLSLKVWDIDPTVTETTFHEGMENLRKSGSLIWKSVHRRKDGSMFPVEVNLKYVRLDRDYVVSVVRDITERLQIERHVTDQLNYTHTMLEASPMGIITYTAEGDAVSANTAAAELVGTTVETLKAQNFRQLQSWKQSGLLEAAEEALQTGREQNLEVRVTTTFGKKMWFSWRFAPFQHEGRRHLLCIFANVAARKQAEMRLLAFSRLGHQLSSARTAREAGEIIVDIADQFFSWDACSLDLYSAEEDRVHHILNRDTIDGKHVHVPPGYDNVPPSPQARKIIQQGARLILRRESEGFADAIPFGDTARPSASLMYVPVRDGAKVVGVLSIQSYRTKAYSEQDLEALQSLADLCGGALNRIRAAEALRETEHRFRDMLANLKLIAMTLDKHGSVTFCNDYLLELTGWKREEVIGQNWFAKFIPANEGRVTEMFFANIDAGTIPLHYINPVLTRTGKILEIAWNNTMLRDIQGNIIGTASIGEDITERNQLEAQLRQAQKMECIGQLAGGVAHDFNNILTAIMMQTELAAMVDAVPAEVREGLQQIQSAARRAASLTQQLLLFSRRQVMQPRELDLNEVVTNLAKMLQRIIGEDVRLQLNLHSKALTVRADAGMLDQVLLNLAVNARDAMPGGGRLLIETVEEQVSEVRARLHPDAGPGRHACLLVSDSGCGIPPEVLPRIFEPFFTTKAPGKGTGLGLATVFGIVKQHRGWIEVESEPGKGAHFRIFLPACNVSAGAAISAPTKPKPRNGSETVLLVEDELPVRMLAHTLLKQHGYQVLEAADGVLALEIWKHRRAEVKLLLTDLVMPGGVNGQQLARQMQAETPELRIIYFSGYSPEMAGKELDLRSGENFLPKPFQPDQLLEIMRRCLDG